MPRWDHFEEYKKQAAELRSRAKAVGLSDTLVTELFKESFAKLKSGSTTKAQKIRSALKNAFLLSIACFFCFYVLLNVHQPTTSLVLRNVQGLTYPTLKFVRYLSVPIIKLFPALTDLYDETCLIENPYFYVSDMECWPCENVFTVLNLTKFEDGLIRKDLNAPFIVKSSEKIVNFNKLKNCYKQYKRTLDSETRSIQSTNRSLSTLKDLFEDCNDGLMTSSDNDVHISWRITKMASARILRKLFPKPFFLPDRSGQSVERFLIIDGAKAGPYLLPNTECSYVFLIQGAGERSIVLKPSKECSDKCRTISVVLKPSYILSYNWWYWRPISLPITNSSKTSITYINSYC